MRSRRVVPTVRPTTERDGALIAWDLQVEAERIDFEGTPIILSFMHDISAEKRKQLMEHIFFHDVLNSTSSLHSAVRLLHPEETRTKGSIEDALWDALEDTHEQILFHRKVVRAEHGYFSPTIETVDCAHEVRTIVEWEQWQTDIKTNGPTFEFHAQPATAETDRVLFRRIVTKMIKNAREASTGGQRIFHCRRRAQ
jgi:hypothetical protein